MLNEKSTRQDGAASGDLHRLWVFYHYLYPDKVVSAVIMDQLSVGLQARGWSVTGLSGNRSSDEENPVPMQDAMHDGVTIRRIWRPRFRQSSTAGRLLNAAWMIAAWSLLAVDDEPPDAIMVGTDPILSVLIAIVWRLAHPGIRIVHWCFDLYPEAAYADGLLAPTGKVSRLLSLLLKKAYAACDVIVDLGPCMRTHLQRYRSPATVDTVTPWALEEPADILPVDLEERREVCGDAQLAMLYSGSFGRAHTYEDFLTLAAALRDRSSSLTFSVRGNRKPDLRAAVECLPPGSTCEIRFVPFAESTRMGPRLAAPDVHLLSLAAHWSGLVVPSKFFGALAVGRPVLFSGSVESSIAQWILQYDLGWLLTPQNVESVAQDLWAYVNDPARVAAMQQRCFDTYHLLFSRQAGLERMFTLLDPAAVQAS
jgi:hypothetical protein